MDKKGALNVSTIATGVIMVIITIIVVFNLVGASASSLTTASTNISSSGLPLASLFGSSGVVLLIFMAGILLAIVAIAMRMHKSR